MKQTSAFIVTLLLAKCQAREPIVYSHAIAGDYTTFAPKYPEASVASNAEAERVSVAQAPTTHTTSAAEKEEGPYNKNDKEPVADPNDRRYAFAQVLSQKKKNAYNIGKDQMDPEVYKFVKDNINQTPFERPRQVPQSFAQVELDKEKGSDLWNKANVAAQNDQSWNGGNKPEKLSTLEGEAWRTFSTKLESPFGGMRTAFYNKKDGLWMQGNQEFVQTESQGNEEPEKVQTIEAVYWQNLADNNPGFKRTTFYNKKDGLWMQGNEELLQTESQGNEEPEKVQTIEAVYWQNLADNNPGFKRTTFYNKKDGLWMQGNDELLQTELKEDPTAFNPNGPPEKVQIIEGEAWRNLYNSGNPVISSDGKPRTTWYDKMSKPNNQMQKLAQLNTQDIEAEKQSVIEGEYWRNLYNKGISPISIDGNVRTTWYAQKDAQSLAQAQDIEAEKQSVIEGEYWRNLYNSGKDPISIDGNVRTTWYAQKDAQSLAQAQDIEAEKQSVIEGEYWRNLYNSGKDPISIDGNVRTTWYAQKDAESLAQAESQDWTPGDQPDKVQTIEQGAWRSAYASKKAPFSSIGNERTTFYSQKE